VFRRLRTRARVRRALAHRRAPESLEWYERIWKPRAISPQTAEFVRERFSRYSGIDFTKVLPSDRVCEDLGFPHVTYGDWDLDLIEEFESAFGVRLNLTDVAKLRTVEDWMSFLEMERQRSSQMPRQNL
jgi:hypothetical protein